MATVNAVATVDDDGASLFVVNRSVTDAAALRVDLAPLVAALGGDLAVVESHLLQDDDLYAANTLANPERVATRPLEGSAIADGVLTATLPPVSWTALRLEARA